MKKQRNLRALIIIITLVWLNHQIFRTVLVVGPSMYPTLQPGEIVLLEKLTYYVRYPQPGEIVAVHAPQQPGVILIKRVTATAGTSIPFLTHTITVPPGTIYILGDNYNESRDSRHFGAIPYHHIVGRVIWRLWPPTSAGWLKQECP